MDEQGYGLMIEGVAKMAFSISMNKDVEVRREPLAGWAQATVSGSQDNFASTKDRLGEVLLSAQRTVEDRTGDPDLVDRLGCFVDAVRDTESLPDLGSVIAKGRSVLSEALDKIAAS